MIRLFNHATTYDGWLVVPVLLDNDHYGFEVFCDHPESHQHPVEKEFSSIDQALEAGELYVQQQKTKPNGMDSLFHLMHFDTL
jgi:hypothetical protein